MKPTNILIQNVNEHWSQWKIKICDFGLAISGISSEMNIQDLRTTTFRYMVCRNYIIIIFLIINIVTTKNTESC